MEKNETPTKKIFKFNWSHYSNSAENVGLSATFSRFKRQLPSSPASAMGEWDDEGEGELKKIQHDCGTDCSKISGEILKLYWFSAGFCLRQGMFRWCTVSPSSLVILSFSLSHTQIPKQVRRESLRLMKHCRCPHPAHTHTHPAHISGRHKFILCVVLHNDRNVNEMKIGTVKRCYRLHAERKTHMRMRKKWIKWNADANGWYLERDDRTAHWFQVPISTCLWWTAYIENDSVF